MTRLQRNLTSFILVTGTLLILVCPFPSRAAFVEQVAISAKAISLANTVTAYPPNVMSIHYNPAGLSHLKEGAVKGESFTFVFIHKTSKFEEDPDFVGFMDTWGPGHPRRDDPHDLDQSDPLAGTEGTNSRGRAYIPFYGNLDLPILVGPSLGITYKPAGSKWTFAWGNYAPFAGGWVHGDVGDPVAFQGQAVGLQHLIYCAPAASYQMTDTLSLGLSMGLGQTAICAEQDMRTPNQLVALTRILGDATEQLEIPVISELTLPPPWFGGGISPYEKVAGMKLSLRDDFSPSYNLGLLWEPTDWFSFGAVYQSSITVHLKGRYEFIYSEQFQRVVDWQGSSPLLLIVSGMLDLPFKPVPGQSGKVVGVLKFPQRVQFGVMLRPFKRLRLLCDAHWANWSVIQEDRFVVDQDIQALQLVKLMGYPYGNRTLVLERQLKDRWHWSFGLEYRISKKLAVRLGYENRNSSIQDHLYDLLYAMPDTDFFGAGIELTLKEGKTIELSFGLITSKGFKVPNNSSTNLNSTDFTKPVYNPYAGLDYEQDLHIYLFSFGLCKPF